MERLAIREQLLHAGGFDVVADTGDGEEVVMLVHRHVLSVLVTDVSLMRRDGLDVAQTLRPRHPPYASCSSPRRRRLSTSWRRCEPARWGSS